MNINDMKIGTSIKEVKSIIVQKKANFKSKRFNQSMHMQQMSMSGDFFNQTDISTSKSTKQGIDCQDTKINSNKIMFNKLPIIK